MYSHVLNCVQFNWLLPPIISHHITVYLSLLLLLLVSLLLLLSVCLYSVLLTCASTPGGGARGSAREFELMYSNWFKCIQVYSVLFTCASTPGRGPAGALANSNLCSQMYSHVFNCLQFYWLLPPHPAGARGSARKFENRYYMYIYIYIYIYIYQKL